MELNEVLSQAVAYLLYVLALAGVVQVAINTIKPQFITPIKERLEASGEERWYLFVFYLFRIAVTAFGFFGVWGGVAAARELLPAAHFISDLGLGIGTVFLVVLGEEVIHPLLDRLYTIIDAVELLEVNNEHNTDGQQPPLG